MAIEWQNLKSELHNNRPHNGIGLPLHIDHKLGSMRPVCQMECLAKFHCNKAELFMQCIALEYWKVSCKR